MNQILQVKDTKQLKPISAKKILLFLLIIIVILGLGIGGYYIYTNVMNGNIQLPIFTHVPKDTSTITFIKIDRAQLVIKVEDQEGISKIIYSINNEEPQIIDIEGETIVEETINIPTGESIINISVIDINGKETVKQENFVVEAPKPVIDLSVIGNDIKITVTSDIDLKEVTYKWNSNNAKKENMVTYENRAKFEKKLEIPIGENTLTIVATDIKGEKTEKVQVIRGVTKTTTTTKVEGGYLHFTVVGKENIEKVEFVFNGQRYLMNTETFGKTKKVHYKVKLIEGKNSLIVKSTTQSGGEDTTSYEQEYTK